MRTRPATPLGSIAVRVVAGAVLVLALGSIPIAHRADAVLASNTVFVGDDVATPGFDEVINLGIDAELVGFSWSGNKAATIEVRANANNAWGEWLELEGSPLESPDGAERKPIVSAGPTWLGHNVSVVEVRVTEGEAASLKVTGIDSEAPTPTGVTLAAEAGADTPQPFIISRQRWGADESLRLTNCPSGPSYASRVKFAVIHHTVNSNSYGPGDSAALVRGIYYFHTQVNGWCDVGYNFLIDRFGQVFEGRFGGINMPVIGGHAGGFNSGSTGISMIGDFDKGAVPGAMYQALRRLVTWKFAYHLIDALGWTGHIVAPSDCNCQRFPVGSAVPVPSIVGHGDLDFTGCPGNYLYAVLDQLRNDVAGDVSQQGRAQYTCQWTDESGDGPSAASPVNGRLDAFIRGLDGALWQNTYVPGYATGWHSLDGYITWGPDAIATDDGRFHVLARGGDGALWHRMWNGSSWTPWLHLGGILSSAPSVASMDGNRVDVFVCGADGALWTISFNGSTWSAWSSLGGIITSAPDVTSWGPGRLDVVARGSDGAMYHRALVSGKWGAWDTSGGGLSSGPGVVSWGPGRIDVVARGLDGALWANNLTASGWYGWYRLGGVLTGDPDVTSQRTNALDVLVRGSDGGTYRIAWDGQRWSTWMRL